MARNSPSLPARPDRRAALGRALALGVGASLHCGYAAAAYVVRAWPAGRPAPALDLLDLAGRRWRLEGHAGQVAVLNFWATWCEPCRLEMPSLDAMAAGRRGEGVVVAAVNHKESPEKIRQFLQRAPFKAPILLDPDGEAAAAWTPRVFPTTVLVGRNGVPAHVVVGELDWAGAAARALLDPLVAAAGRT